MQAKKLRPATCEQTEESMQLLNLANNLDYCGVIKLLKSVPIKNLETTIVRAGFATISAKHHGKDRAINYVLDQAVEFLRP